MNVPEELRRGIGWDQPDRDPPHHPAPAKTEVSLPVEAAEMAAKIKAAHEEARTAFHRSFEKAIEVGNLLIDAKLKIDHGLFGKWIKAECGISERTARAYMQAARELPVIETAESAETITLKRLLAGPKDKADTPALAREKKAAVKAINGEPEEYKTPKPPGLPSALVVDDGALAERIRRGEEELRRRTEFRCALANDPMTIEGTATEVSEPWEPSPEDERAAHEIADDLGLTIPSDADGVPLGANTMPEPEYPAANPLDAFTDTEILDEAKRRYERNGFIVKLVPVSEEQSRLVLAWTLGMDEETPEFITNPQQLDLEDAIAAAPPATKPDEPLPTGVKRERKYDPTGDVLYHSLQAYLTASGRTVKEFCEKEVPSIPYNSFRIWAGKSPTQNLPERYRPVVEAALSTLGAS